MTMLLDSISSEIESAILSGDQPRQTVYTRIVTGGLSICRDISCIGLDGYSITHRGEVFRHKPLMVDRHSGLICTRSVNFPLVEDGMDMVTIQSGYDRSTSTPTVSLLLEVFFGVEFVTVDTMLEYYRDSDDVTLTDLLNDGVLVSIPFEERCKYHDYVALNYRNVGWSGR